MMSDKSIIITEKQIIDVMDKMCIESLDPESFEAWENIMNVLYKVRRSLSKSGVLNASDS